ncbi:hypothetical protein BCON_0451g00070 [Botryotinia convoluta]|uniref:Uncharacterized protein n=1 Tax=Botryotinia convoluta TaxID=54673 RepID=A0A4Z1H9K9_9HELO|nr:hypothetical protein BCON_0451g00070 [Botryotinia convoluta]
MTKLCHPWLFDGEILAAGHDLRPYIAHEFLKPLEYVADVEKRTLSQSGRREFAIELLNQIVSSDN